MAQDYDDDFYDFFPDEESGMRFRELWDTAYEHIAERKPKPLSAVRPVVLEFPQHAEVLLLAAVAALLEEQPDQALSYVSRFLKRYEPFPGIYLIRSIAMAQKGNMYQADQIFEKGGLYTRSLNTGLIPCGEYLHPWLNKWLKKIGEYHTLMKVQQVLGVPVVERRKPGKAKESQTGSRRKAAPEEPAPPSESAPAAQAAEEPLLPRVQPKISISVTLPQAGEPASLQPEKEPGWFELRSEFVRLNLLQGFDELLCLPLLRGVNTYWYQIETVRKVLKQFRGRVLLADEVGLGKTVEAGMALKEYLLRGMVERVLILTPASMVGQWVEEMQSKFNLEFASTYDPLLRKDAASFWAQPRVIASISTARRSDHFETLRSQAYDVVIVDEAHHLKNRATSNWKLVDALQKRFLLLLSATPVQNSLVELYNLLTLLKPGIFKTEKEFRSTYMTAGKPRVPANRERMRDLMRDVMIRNTRSQVDVRLPSRHAAIVRLDAEGEEAACYLELSRLVQQVHQSDASRHRLALRHLLSAAGSSPVTAAAAIHRFIAAGNPGGEWEKLYSRYLAQPAGSKEKALFELLGRNPGEKKMIFVHHRETLSQLDRLLKTEGLEFERFDGTMSGPEKDRAVERFRDHAEVLLCTESGGEGRNLQFCNTLINFDLPWNPMSIEQRIGRLHRIGQSREVFVFNMVVRGTIEEMVLKILDEKINMFELVVGEIDAILGEMEDNQEFAEMVFDTWVETTERDRASRFDELGDRLLKARRQYEAVKELDEHLFGDEFVTA